MAANYVARWDGMAWTAVGGGTNYQVDALTVYDDGGGPALHVGGQFTMAGDVDANKVAKWDGSSWAALGSGMNLLVRDLTVHDDGNGPVLYAGGDFTHRGRSGGEIHREMGRHDLGSGRQRGE